MKNNSAIVLFVLCAFLWIGLNSSASYGSTDTLYNFNSNPCLFKIENNEALLSNTEAIRAGLLFDMDSQTIVWHKDLNYAYPIASLTKMMVALLAMEDVNAGKVRWDDTVEVTRVYYRGRGRYKRKVSVQETYNLKDLVTMAMVPSHNESTHWIANHLNGSADLFVERMNQRAIELNMMQTHYSNPSGLPASSSQLDNSSTPYDMLLLSQELVKYPELLQITKIGYAEINNGKSNQVYRNHNGLVREFENEVDGLKTGYTRNAKYCLAATSVKEGKRLICIVFGVSNVYTRNSLVSTLLSNYYLTHGILALGGKTEAEQEKEPSSEGIVEDLAAENNSDETEEEPVELVKQISTVKKYHKVRSGESLFKIADRYNVYTSDIKRWNRLKSSTIYSGQRLVVYQKIIKYVPVTDLEDASPSEAMAPSDVNMKTVRIESNSNNSLTQSIVTYTVQPGDTLWSIARKYEGITVEQIKKSNKIFDARSLKPGTKLKIEIKG